MQKSATIEANKPLGNKNRSRASTEGHGCRAFGEKVACRTRYARNDSPAMREKPWPARPGRKRKTTRRAEEEIEKPCTAGIFPKEKKRESLEPTEQADVRASLRHQNLRFSSSEREEKNTCNGSPERKYEQRLGKSKKPCRSRTVKYEPTGGGETRQDPGVGPRRKRAHC